MATVADPPPTEPSAIFYKFPPFPKPPPGATIPVFSEFKPAGIQISLDPDLDDVERDGRGIPTVKLASSHSLTANERMKHKGKKMRKTTVLPNGQQVRLKWYEEWEELENTRRTNIDPSLNRIDRLHEAAAAFKSGRPWPPPLPEYNPLLIWDYWRLFLGLISSIQSEPKKEKKQFDPADVDEDSEGEDNAADTGTKTASVNVVEDPEVRKRLEEERRVQREQKQKTLDEQALARKEHFRERRDTRKDSFLNDPVFSVKIFFSSHWRDKGYIHDEKKCLEGPILIGFFLKYLIRNRVFPEEEAKLKSAIELCDLARKELPATWTLGRSLPDKLSKGFEDLNSMMTSGMYGRGLIFANEDEDDDEDSDDEPDADQRETKKRKLDAAEELCRDEPTVQVIDPEKMDLDATAHADAIADNVDVNGEEVKPSGWGALDSDAADAWNDTPWGDVSEWVTMNKNHLFEYFGPTTLPFTHTTGIIERSTRKIAKVVRPPPADEKKTKKNKDISQVDAIEQDFESRMGFVVLTPWLKVGNHVASDLVPPDILPDSRGAVVVPELTKSDLMNHGIKNGGRVSADEPPSVPHLASSPHPPFDPKKDEIHLLVDPQHLDMFEQFVGMGVCATWVQIVRKETPGDDVNEPVDYSTKKGRKKPQPRGAPGKNGEPTKWWYMEQVSFALTSFHTDIYYPDQDED